MNEERSRRRQRAPRSRDIQNQLAALGPVENPYPPIDVLSPEGLSRIVDAAFLVLEEMGLEFRSGRALALLKANGAIVDEASQMVRMGRDLVEHFVGLAPERFPVHARNRERDTVMGGRRINFNTVGSPPNVSDLDRGRRPGSYEALCDLVKLNHALGVIHLVGGAVVEPMDLPVPTRHLDNAYALLRYTDRPVMVRAVSRFRAEDAINMVAIARGRTLDELLGEPSVLTSINVNSPRRIDEELLGVSVVRLVFLGVDAIDRTRIYAGAVLRADTRFCNDISHFSFSPGDSAVAPITQPRRAYCRAACSSEVPPCGTKAKRLCWEPIPRR